MRTGLVLMVSVVLSAGCAKRSMEGVVPPYTDAFNTAFKRMGSLGLADTQTRIQRLGDAGKAFEPQLAELQRRQHEVNDLIVKAVETKKQAVVDQKPEAVEAATEVLRDADAKAQALRADLTKLEEKLTAAGAPLIAPGPPRDPNARD